MDGFRGGSLEWGGGLGRSISAGERYSCFNGTHAQIRVPCMWVPPSVALDASTLKDWLKRVLDN